VIVAVLLAAGRGQRFGGNKLTAAIGGIPMVVQAARKLLGLADRVVAPVRPGDKAVPSLLEAEGVEVIPCAQAVSGMGSSIGCGVHASRQASGWIIVLADMPFILRETIAEVRRRLDQGAAIVAPTYHARRGHPVGFNAEFGSALEALHGDEGAHALIAADAGRLVTFSCEDPGVLQDIDRPCDLDAALKERPTPRS